jgi:hypothetical protein
MSAQRLEATMARLDSVLDQRVRREEAELAAESIEREAARRQRQRDYAESRRVIAETYADAYASFGTEVPAPADDEAPSGYRRRLYNRLARKLPTNHDLADLRADDLGGSALVFDNFEQLLLDAAKAEGFKPSIENLPSDGSLREQREVDRMVRASFIHRRHVTFRTTGIGLQHKSRRGDLRSSVALRRHSRRGRANMGESTVRSPWSLERGGPSNSRPGVSPQSSGGNRADSPHSGGKGWTPPSRRDMPIEQPHDGNRVVEPVVRDKDCR